MRNCIRVHVAVSGYICGPCEVCVRISYKVSEVHSFIFFLSHSFCLTSVYVLSSSKDINQESRSVHHIGKKKKKKT